MTHVENVHHLRDQWTDLRDLRYLRISQYMTHVIVFFVMASIEGKTKQQHRFSWFWNDVGTQELNETFHYNAKVYIPQYTLRTSKNEPMGDWAGRDVLSNRIDIFETENPGEKPSAPARGINNEITRQSRRTQLPWVIVARGSRDGITRNVVVADKERSKE
jgi:hypothetical protein